MFWPTLAWAWSDQLTCPLSFKSCFLAKGCYESNSFLFLAMDVNLNVTKWVWWRYQPRFGRSSRTKRVLWKHKPRLAEHGQISNVSPYPSSQRMPAQNFFLFSGDYCDVITFDNLDQANLLRCFWQNKVSGLSPMLTLMFSSKGGLLRKSINGEPSNLLCSAWTTNEIWLKGLS